MKEKSLTKDELRVLRYIDKLDKILQEKLDRANEKRDRLIKERNKLLFESGDLIEFL